MVGQTFTSSSLYVGDLAPSVSETTLYEVFSTIGPVASIRVCRETASRRSLGYAYVNYHSVSDAQRCLETLNYTPIRGVPCRIMWSHRDPALRRSGAGNIFVKNLDKVVDTKALHDTFSIFGNILSCKVARDEFGKSRGYGFVHYESEQSAKLAIERINGMSIGAKKVYVGPFKKHTDRSDIRPKHFTNLYVKHIPKEWEESTVNDVFAPYGAIQSMVVSSDAKGRVFTLVNYEDPEAAYHAVEELHGRKVNASGVEPADNVYLNIKQSNPTLLECKKSDDSTHQQSDDDTQHVAEQQAADSTADHQKTMNAVDSEEQAPKEAVKLNQAEESTNQQEEQIMEEVKEDTANPEKIGEEDDTTAVNKQTDTACESQKSDVLAFDDIPEDRLYVQRAMTRAERIASFKDSLCVKDKVASVNLFVKNLNPQVTDESLREAFSKFGTVISTKVMENESGVSRGFGFVSFAFPEEATKAVTAMHLKLFYGKPLYVGLAERKQYRSARLQQRYKSVQHATLGATTQANFPVLRQPQVQQVPNMIPSMRPPPQQQQMMMIGNTQQQQPQSLYANNSNMFYATPIQRIPPQQPDRPPYVPSNYTPQPFLPQQQQPQTQQQPAATTWRRDQQQPGRPQGYFPSTMMPYANESLLQQQRRPQQQQPGLPNSRRSLGGTLTDFKFTPQARNRHDFIQPSSQHDQQIQKQLLGERLYPLVSKHQPELAGKITGMMLEMDNSELLALIESERLLSAKVEEAYGVLQRHHQGSFAQQSNVMKSPGIIPPSSQ